VCSSDLVSPKGMLRADEFRRLSGFSMTKKTLKKFGKCVFLQAVFGKRTGCLRKILVQTQNLFGEGVLLK